MLHLTKLASLLLAASSAIAAVVPVDDTTSVTAEILAKRKLEGTLIGWRYMDDYEYQQSKTKLIYEKQGDGGTQIGDGVYTGKGSKTWPPYKADNNYWICAVVVDTTAWNKLKKVTIPGKDGCDILWWKPDNVNEYVKKQTKTDGSAKVVSFSQIDGVIGERYQALIGPDLVSSTNFQLDCCKISDTKCRDRLVKDYGDQANYDSFKITGGAPKPDAYKVTKGR